MVPADGSSDSGGVGSVGNSRAEMASRPNGPPGTSTEDAGRVLSESEALSVQVAVLEADAAAVIATISAGNESRRESEESNRVGNPVPGRCRPRTMQTTLATIRILIGMLAVAIVLAGACRTDSTDDADSESVAPVETSRPSVDAELEPSGEGGVAPSTDSTDDADSESVVPVETSRPSVDAELELSGEGGVAPSAGDGWIGGEPDWYDSGASDEASAEYEAMADEAVEMAPATTAAPATTMAAAAAATTIGPEDEVVYESEQPQTTLTGGSIDDNERLEDYLAYRADFFGLGIAVRDLDPTGRIVVTVTGEGNLPAAGAEVVVAGEEIEVSLRTTADGTVRFHPEAYAAGAGPFTVSAGGATTEAARGQSVALETSLPTAAGEAVALDVLFLLDATGSMHDEIYQLKITIDEVAQRIHRLPGDVDVRLGMTLYRDEFDSFLTATFDLTPDVEAFAEALSAVVADGGDDYPEALDEALADALSQPSWRSASDTVQLVFLVADAPPQVHRRVPVPYTESMREAARRGIKIFPVSSSGTDDQAEFVFRQVAQFTGARYVFLTYGAEGRATGAASDIDQRDYEELSLDDLIVRLVAEELSALVSSTGPEPGPEPPATPEDGEEGN